MTLSQSKGHTMDQNTKLGVQLRDIVTGFEGIATGRIEYLNGCIQFLVQPVGVTDKGERKEGVWIDHQQLEVIGAGIEVPQRVTGGPAPAGTPTSYRG